MSFIKQIQKYFVLAILFLLPLYLIKFKFVWLSFNLVEILIFILFLLWVFGKKNRYQILDTRYNIPIILIIIGLILSTIANKNFYVGLGAIKGWFAFPVIFGIIFYESLKEDESLLGKSCLALFSSGVAISFIGVVYKFLGILTYDGRLKIFWDSPNQFAMFLAIPCLIGIWQILPRPDLGATPRSGLGIGLVLVAINLYFTFSYGAWLALAMALGVLFWLKYSEIKQKKYLAIFTIILLIFLGWASFGKYKSLENRGGRSSLDSRIMIWRSAGLMLEKNPLFGIGPGNFQNKYLEYQKYFPPYLEWAVPQPHNLLLAFWLEAGLVGLAGFILLLVQFFKDNKKAIENNRLFGALCLAIMLYFLIHGLVDTTYWRNDMAIVFWMMISINMFLSTNKTTHNNKISN